MFVGIDLAANPRNTGVAVVSGGEECVVKWVEVGAKDDALVCAIQGAHRAGVDVPFGWPTNFVETLNAHHTGALTAPASTGPEWRRALAMRETDRWVHQRTGITPLSVSTDRIAHTALRWAGIEARLRELGADVSRDGSGAVSEVYPAAALQCWSLRHRGYKGAKNAGRRTELTAALAAMHRLDWNGNRGLCIEDDDALDAVISALLAREIARGKCEPPPRQLADTARREGWIWLPRG